MEEIWKDIPGQEGFYQASNLGRVRSLDRLADHKLYGKWFKKGQVLNFGVCVNGYIEVRMLGKREYIHSIIARTFISDRPAGLVVDHIDGNRINNTPGNLRYVTPAQNNSFPGEKNGFSKLTAKQVLEIRAKYVWKIYGVTKLGKEYGIHPTHIHDIITRQRWKHI